MNIEQLLTELRSQHERLTKAIAALERLQGSATVTHKNGRRGRRVMSADARARISKAMKRRWALRKRAA